MSRYKTQGAWDRVTTHIFTDGDDKEIAIVVTEIADVLDTRTGHFYRGGSYRVRVPKCNINPKPRGKTFVGETAWSRAENYHDKAVSEIRHAQPDHFQLKEA